MVIARHGPETCPASVSSAREKYMPHLARIEEISGNLGVDIRGRWVDMPGHAIYMIAEAPHAHVVQQMAMDARLMDWNTVDVHAVVEMDVARRAVETREI